MAEMRDASREFAEREGDVDVGGVEVASGFGGSRFAFRKTRSGGMVSLSCLNTYFAMAVANSARFGAGLTTSPFAAIC